MRELPTLVEQILEPPPVDDHHEDGLLENTGCDVCVVLQYLQRRNQSLTFLGDSMTHQTVQGLVCELYRRNYLVQEEVLRFNYGRGGGGGGGGGGRGRGKRRRRTEKTNQNHNNNNNNSSSSSRSDPSIMTSNCTGINHCLHLVRTIRVSSPLWPPGSSVTIKFFHHYRLPFVDISQRDMVLQAASNGVLILNYGLHWGANNHGRQGQGPPEQQGSLQDIVPRPYFEATSPNNPPNPRHLEGALADFLNQLAEHSSPSIASSSKLLLSTTNSQPRILIRETSAQHFDAPQGDYSFVKKEKHPRQDPLRCVPYQDEPIDMATTTTTTNNNNNNHTNDDDTPVSRDWRKTVLYGAAQRAKYTVDVVGPHRHHHQPPPPPQTTSSRSSRRHVTVLPFADFTKALHGLHPYEEAGGGKGGDCTHYCSTPFVYYPLWRSIRMALQ